MEKIKVVVRNSTRSQSREAELLVASGLVIFEDGEISHIVALKARDFVVLKAVEAAPAPEVRNEVVLAPEGPQAKRGRKKKGEK